MDIFCMEMPAAKAFLPPPAASPVRLRSDAFRNRPARLPSDGNHGAAPPGSAAMECRWHRPLPGQAALSAHDLTLPGETTGPGGGRPAGAVPAQPARPGQQPPSSKRQHLMLSQEQQHVAGRMMSGAHGCMDGELVMRMLCPAVFDGLYGGLTSPAGS